MLNPKEEAKFAELKDICRELKVPAPPEIFIGLQVHDKNGVLVFDDRQRGHSWTRNFYGAMYGFLAFGPGGGISTFGAGYMATKTTGGTVEATASAGQIQWQNSSTGFFTANNGGIVNSVTGGTTYGIVVGTGDTAFSVDHFTLATLIASGNAATQLAYQLMAIGTSAYTAGTKTWKATHRRIFNNNSGGSITVKEAGLYARGAIFYSSDTQYYMIERSVLDPIVAVANGAQLTVTYEISMDFSAID